MALEDLTKADIIRAGSISEKEAVRKAFDKLKFAILMSHSEEEIVDLCDNAVYQVRIAQKTADGSTYDNFMIRWADDQFVVYSPAEGGPVAGIATTLDKDPALIYFNDPPLREQLQISRVTTAMSQALRKKKK